MRFVLSKSVTCTRFVAVLAILAALLTGCAENSLSASVTPKPLDWKVCPAKGACGATSFCEGRLVELSGTIDRFNIYDQQVNPLFANNKFLFNAQKDHPAWEVWLDTVPASDRQVLFSRLRLAASTNKPVRLVARAVGVDAQFDGACERFVRFEISGLGALKE
jgi:hypothetical protein